MALKMKDKFGKYCNFEKVNQLFWLFMVVDPGYKLEDVKFN